MEFPCQATFPSSFCADLYCVCFPRKHMGHKALFFLRFLILFLTFSLLHPSITVSTTRILKSKSDNYPSAQASVFQDARDFEISGGDSFENLFEGRMILENNDYPGTGANNHHDPNSPAARP